jgi:molecular chaperone GrpE
VTEQSRSAEAAEEVAGASADQAASATPEGAPDATSGPAPTAAADAAPEAAAMTTEAEPGAGPAGPAGHVDEADVADALHPDTVLAAERLSDLQRLQAEYVNYKRRVDRDRAVVQERAAQSVIEALLPVLDDIHAAREHGDLEGGPFAAIADKLEGVLGKFGLERYGVAGEEFDPMLHEALMHTAWPADGSIASTGSTTVIQVLQPGYRAGEQVLRPARVAVADPE